MKFLLLAAASALAASVAACGPARPVARAALDCPAKQGDLTRTSVSADGKTCLYASGQGDEVSLRLIPVTNGPQAALDPVEQELQVQTEPPPTKAAPAAGTDVAPAAADAEHARDEARRDAAAANGEEASRDRGDQVNIALPGIHITAENDRANVNVGMVHVDAGEHGAVIRMARDVRLRGEAFSREKRGFRATYILAREDLAGGYKAVGYEAGGPRTGPLAVAVVKARRGDHDHLFNDVKRLVRRNGGV